MSLLERVDRKGPKKLLAIDGGGIRGVLSLEVLQKVETLLKEQSGRADFVLADYFDYIAGTSTGGIVAAGLSVGMPVAKLMDFYVNAGEQMFEKASLLKRLQYKYEDEPLAKMLRGVLGEATTLGSDNIKTLLLLVMRNATTDSPWPISNNPHAKYNDPLRPDCNLNFPLWKLVRASTAAPTFFPPEVIVLPDREGGKDKQFVFVDGGVTMYNNPAFQMFLMATVDRYWVRAPAGRRGWPTGADKMLIVSVGTGTSPGAKASLEAKDMNLLFNATTIPSALMFAALNEQDLLCRVFGDCRAGGPLDREIDTLNPNAGPLAPDRKLFTYLRYNAELTSAGLKEIGCGDIQPEAVQQLDSVDAIGDLRKVGQAVAEQVVAASHFAGFAP